MSKDRLVAVVSILFCAHVYGQTNTSGATCISLREPANIVATHATAERRLPNTVVDVRASVETEAATVAEVTKTLGAKSQSLIGYLKAQGAERLLTESVNVDTKTHTSRGGPDKIVGYSGTLSVSFRTTPEKASDLLTGVLTNGANRVEDVTFSAREEEIAAAKKELAAEATKTAMEQAESVAKAAGERITGVKDIAVDEHLPMSSAPQGLAGMEFNSGAAYKQRLASPPIATASGEQRVSVTVELRASLER